MCHVNHGRLGPIEKETVEIELGEEKSEGSPKITFKSKESFYMTVLPMNQRSCMFKLQQEGFRLDLNSTNIWHWWGRKEASRHS